ncbi:hypothetical protein [Silvimonas iriomotensis]|uniref:Uncharacterized protein n=1 Tax=Silvimonas iriomotensis TaxID=449662 RepID=A0ABQ2P3X5_9NEIS|nr:hypothetical protein [Silvimonas iriomotensis]GGP17702.1 hypothetical protein GCM10010970_01050 [Silvimonas iriomotensis]
MSHLVDYINAMHGARATAKIVHTETTMESWLDDGYEVTRQDITCTFDNGVVIRRQLEQDQFPTDLACAECWISYEVLQQPASQSAVTPARISFDNACREQFWRRYFSA